MVNKEKLHTPSINHNNEKNEASDDKWLRKLVAKSTANCDTMTETNNSLYGDLEKRRYFYCKQCSDTFEINTISHTHRKEFSMNSSICNTCRQCYNDFCSAYTCHYEHRQEVLEQIHLEDINGNIWVRLL